MSSEVAPHLESLAEIEGLTQIGGRRLEAPVVGVEAPAEDEEVSAGSIRKQLQEEK